MKKEPSGYLSNELQVWDPLQHPSAAPGLPFQSAT